MPTDANAGIYELYDQILRVGHLAPVRKFKLDGTPDSETIATKEVNGFRAHVDMTRPVCTLSRRGLGYRFMCAEAAWILSGDNRLSTIHPFSPVIGKYADDTGEYLQGAYGPRVVDQLSYVVDTLAHDPTSRQAVMTIWRSNPRKHRDVPCTVSVQFMIREDKLHLFHNMRSSDAWLGTPYDWFTFSMLGGLVVLLLRKRMRWAIDLGTLHFYSASEHLYEDRWRAAGEVVVAGYWQAVDFEYEPFDPFEFDEPQDLITHLWHLARKNYQLCTGTFLRRELREYHDTQAK